MLHAAAGPMTHEKKMLTRYSRVITIEVNHGRCPVFG